MTGRTALLVLGIVTAAGAAVSARAQCRLCDTPTTSQDQEGQTGRIALEVEAGLDFDRLILLAPGPGSVILQPDGSHQVSGTVGAVSAKAMVGQARVRGEAGRAIRIDLPARIELYSIGGSRILLEDIVSDLPAAPRLDSAGVLSFRFGGRLTISGDSEGDYRGDVPITVEYL